MTERDWEASARQRLEKNVAATVANIRARADTIEREAKRNIEAAVGDRPLTFETYPRVAEQVVHGVQTMVFNLPLTSIIDAAGQAETARSEKGTEEL